MAKLFFKTGTMGGGKTLDLLRCKYNYEERGMKTLAFKPILDTSEGVKECLIRSRTGMECEAIWIEKDMDLTKYIMDYLEKNKLDVIIIDEVQFLTEKQIEQLQEIVYDLHIPIICYGLTTDFRGYLFPSISRLIALADDISRIKAICWCGAKASQNARVINGEMVIEGNQIEIKNQNDIKYIALCNRHFRERKISNKVENQ